jgi:pimeloyl-ACP methyl ester carboxylesterase
MPPEALRPKLDQSALLDYEFETPSETGASTLSNGSFRKNFQVSRFTFTFLSWVWESNLTPMDGIRWLGPFGHLAVAGTLERRANKCGPNSALRKLTPEQAQALIDFTYQNQANPPSGERALAPIFIPGAYAKKPLFLWLRGPLYRQRAAQLNDQRSPPRSGIGRRARDDDDDDLEEGSRQGEECLGLLGSGSARGSASVAEGSVVSAARPPSTPLSPRSRADVKTIDCPVSLIYGSPDLDWMRSKYGADLCEQLRKEGVDARLYQMKESGHIVYMEDPEDFVNCVMQAFFNRENFHQVYRPS